MHDIDIMHDIPILIINARDIDTYILLYRYAHMHTYFIKLFIVAIDMYVVSILYDTYIMSYRYYS